MNLSKAREKIAQIIHGGSFGILEDKAHDVCLTKADQITEECEEEAERQVQEGLRNFPYIPVDEDNNPDQQFALGAKRQRDIMRQALKGER